jgi:endonuclease/exonuclease/phosphatase (EEP) superfamily protein YafD
MQTRLRRAARLCPGLILLLAAALPAGCWASRTPEKPTGPWMKVVTWNINWGGGAPEEVVATLIEVDADVVCLQETTPAWEQYLRPHLADRYPHMLFRHAERFPAAGFAVLSKGAIEREEGEPEKGGVFGAGLFVVQTPIGRVQLCNAHLHPPFNLQTGSLSLIPTAQDRRQEVERLWNRLDPSIPVLMLGDMNEGDGGEALGWLKKRGLVDALYEFDPRSHTWRWPLGWITLHERLDHVLYRGPLYCLDAFVLDRGQSDHLPIVAAFEVRPGAGQPDR